jgi:phosphoribosylanthranilate isomerase
LRTTRINTCGISNKNDLCRAVSVSADAIDYVQPYEVDVSSGVAKQPESRDREKINIFIKCVRKAGNEKTK